MSMSIRLTVTPEVLAQIVTYKANCERLAGLFEMCERDDGSCTYAEADEFAADVGEEARHLLELLIDTYDVSFT
jgi:hypothetical protein